MVIDWLSVHCRMMESKVAEAMNKKETLKARVLSAETTKQLNDSITSMVCDCICCNTDAAVSLHMSSTV